MDRMYDGWPELPLNVVIDESESDSGCSVSTHSSWDMWSAAESRREDEMSECSGRCPCMYNHNRREGDESEDNGWSWPPLSRAVPYWQRPITDFFKPCDGPLPPCRSRSVGVGDFDVESQPSANVQVIDVSSDDDCTVLLISDDSNEPPHMVEDWQCDDSVGAYETVCIAGVPEEPLQPAEQMEPLALVKRRHSGDCDNYDYAAKKKK